MGQPGGSAVELSLSTACEMSSVFDPELVARARSGDEAARNRLLRNIEPILRAFFTKRLNRVDDVDDLVQNTLIRIHRSLDDLKQPDRLKAFSMKAAFFEIQDFYRGRYSLREALFDPDLPTPGSVAPENVAAGIDAERALELLSPKAREILELREMGYPYVEIAEMVDTTEAAVKMQVKRAFDRLRELLASTATVISLFLFP